MKPGTELSICKDSSRSLITWAGLAPIKNISWKTGPILISGNLLHCNLPMPIQ